MNTIEINKCSICGRIWNKDSQVQLNPVQLYVTHEVVCEQCKKKELK